MPHTSRVKLLIPALALLIAIFVMVIISTLLFPNQILWANHKATVSIEYNFVTNESDFVTNTNKVAVLSAYFEQIDYNLEDVLKRKNDVPRFFLKRLPEDISNITSAKERKKIFVKSILPLILLVNEDIAESRKAIKKMKNHINKGLKLSKKQLKWLENLENRYETEPFDWQELLNRVDVIPPSLAIAQAAEESGWGTSRFAREGNALFGQYTFGNSNGMLPKEREIGDQHLIRIYSNLVEGIRSYMHNLNYHYAYNDFRSIRGKMRSNHQLIDGHLLAGTLTNYSERGSKYVKTIQHIISSNKLIRLDSTKLMKDIYVLSSLN